MSHFYITLPSDGSEDIFPSNTAANFKTRLATPISSVGEWDVALYEIHCMRLWDIITGMDAEIIYEIIPPSITEQKIRQHNEQAYTYIKDIILL